MDFFIDGKDFVLKIFRFSCLWWIHERRINRHRCTVEVALSIVSLEHYYQNEIWSSITATCEKYSNLFSALL